MKNVCFFALFMWKENLLLGCGFLILVSFLPLVASASVLYRYRTTGWTLEVKSWIWGEELLHVVKIMKI